MKLIASFCFFLGGLFAQTEQPKNTSGLTEGFVTSAEDRGDKILLIACTDESQQRCWAVPVGKEFRPQKGWGTKRWHVFHRNQFPIGEKPRHDEPTNRDRDLPAVIWLVEHSTKSNGGFRFVSNPLPPEWKKLGYMEMPRPK